ISQSINRVHLFNCDNTYKLEPVEHLLNKIAELDGHHMCVVKHSFKLAKMSEIVDKISTLAMDMAVFVVHAHESWPSSNEDNRGIGFTKIYRALLQATGGNVIIVIGGDNKYEGFDEEERGVISLWAKRKVSSQFSEESVTGAREIKEWKTLDSRAEGSNISRKKASTTTANNQGAGSEEIIRPPIGETIELSILGCNVSCESVDDAKKVFARVLPSLHLSKDPFVGNLPINKVEEYLRDYHFRFSVLVVDGYTVRDGCDDQRSKELQRLVRLAVDKVDEKVIILVCNGQSTTDTYNEFIGQIDKLEKTFVVRVNNGKLMVDPEILYYVLSPQMPCSTPNAQSISQEQDLNAYLLSTYSYKVSENYPQRNSSEGKSIDEMSAQNSQQLVLGTQFSERPPPVVVLRSFVRRGEISYQKEDHQIGDPEFQVPSDIQERLFHSFWNKPPVGVRVIKLSNGSTECYVDHNLKQFTLDEEIQLDTGKKLLLKTCVRNGKVSFEDNDVKYKYRNNCIPEHIIDDLQKRKADGDLYISLHDSGKFEAIIKRRGKIEQAANAANAANSAAKAIKETKEKALKASKKAFGFRSLGRNSEN
ncbi:unnamed protein product, partial [Pocillopora meandrina]